MSKRAFERIVVIIFENEFRGNVMQNAYMRSLAAKGIELANYFGVMHPSNTNYVASAAGEICNVTHDPQYYAFLPQPPGAPAPSPGPAPLSQKTIADTIVEKGLEWRAYMGGYSPVDFPPSLTPILDSSGQINIPATVKQTILDYPPYMNMHNPFVRFSSIVSDKNQWKRIGTSDDFLRDALSGTLPEYSWFTPGMWDCGHWLTGTYAEAAQRAPYLVDQLAKWLETFFDVLAFPGPNSRLQKGTLVVVTFDEADINDSYEKVRNWDNTYDGPNQVYTVLLGDGIIPQRIEQEGYNHYSLLRTVEKNFDLPALGKNDTDANWFQFLWGKTYTWGASEPTPIGKATIVAAASLGDTLYVVHGSGGALSCRTRTNGTWSAEEQPVPAPENVTKVDMASANGNLILICQSGGALSALSMSNGAWSAPQQLATGAQAFSLISYLDYGDQTEKLMLAWSTSSGLQSQIFANGQWTTPVAVGQQGGGAVALATLGGSVFLIYQAAGTSAMNVASYNTAPFNVVTSGGNSNTTQYAWSPSVCPVQHFAAGPTRASGGDESLAPYEGAAPFAAASLDGVIHFIHRAAKDSTLCSTTFSISGVLTSQNPVSYKQSGTGLSNGYGTLAEAGWSRRVPVSNLPVDASSAMTLARAGSELVLLWQERSGAPLHLIAGGYR